MSCSIIKRGSKGLKETLKAVDDFIAYKRKHEAQGSDTRGWSMVLNGVSDKHYEAAVKYYELAMTLVNSKEV